MYDGLLQLGNFDSIQNILKLKQNREVPTIWCLFPVCFP